MTATQLIVVAAAIFTAAFVQVIAGFGFALLSMPIMTLALPVKEAVVVSTVLGMLSTTWQAVHLRHQAERTLVKRMVIGACLGMPLGLFILSVVSDTSLRLVLGIAVLVATVLLVSPVNFAAMHPSFDVGVGFVSGVLNTSLSTNGPPRVFGLQARRLDPSQFRATISVTFAICNIVTLALFVVRGLVTADGLKAAAIALPAWVVGQGLGWPVRKHLHGDRFRRLVLALLFLAGVSTIVFALL
ncbi:MAG: sulfite exporter TauE/SafE family protein [Acidobacteria bacterium]|nr:sulfite exporter TauE/SafE family protein [Acidobacteriota bacterium]